MSLLGKLERYEFQEGDKPSMGERLEVLDSQRVELVSPGILLRDKPLRATLVEKEVTRGEESLHVAALEFKSYTSVEWLLHSEDHIDNYWQVREALNNGDGYEVKVTSEGLIDITTL